MAEHCHCVRGEPSVPCCPLHGQGIPEQTFGGDVPTEDAGGSSGSSQPASPPARCPSCGQAVRVVSTGEGTCHYEPVAERERDQARSQLDKARGALQQILHRAERGSVIADIARAALLAEPSTAFTPELNPTSSLPGERKETDGR